jgi:hypothetical protein
VKESSSCCENLSASPEPLSVLFVKFRVDFRDKLCRTQAPVRCIFRGIFSASHKILSIHQLVQLKPGPIKQILQGNGRARALYAPMVWVVQNQFPSHSSTTSHMRRTAKGSFSVFVRFLSPLLALLSPNIPVIETIHVFWTTFSSSKACQAC